MMIESISLDKIRGQGGEGGRRGAWWMAAAAGLMLLAAALAWSGTRSAARSGQYLALVDELQLGARDVGVLSFLALSGDKAAAGQLPERSAGIDSALAALTDGSKHKGESVAPPSDFVRGRLNPFATRWAELKRRINTLLELKAAAEARRTRDANRGRQPEQRPSAARAQKAPAPAERGAEAGAATLSLLGEARALAATIDSLRSELDEQQARVPWLLMLALVCILAAASIPMAFGVSARRAALALQRAAEASNAATLEVLRPAMTTLRIEVDAAALADPALLGRRLSAEILVVIDGIKTLVKALDAATTEADKFSVVGHVAARALTAAEQKAAQTGASLQATARRMAAVYAAFSAGAAEAQQQCAQSLNVVGSGQEATKDSARLADQVRDQIEHAARGYAQIAATNAEIARGLVEVADLLMQTEGLALRAGSRLANSASSEAVAFANDVRSYVNPCAAELKHIMELTQRVERESAEFSKQLAQARASAADQSRGVGDGARALGAIEFTLRDLAAKISAMSRLASGAEAAQLLSSLDDIVRQIAESSVSARQVLDATKNAATQIEELSRILNTMKAP